MTGYRSAFAGVLGFVGGVSPDLLSGLASIGMIILAWVWFEGRMRKNIEEAIAARDALYAERWKNREKLENEKHEAIQKQLETLSNRFDQLFNAVPKRKEDK